LASTLLENESVKRLTDRDSRHTELYRNGSLDQAATWCIHAAHDALTDLVADVVAERSVGSGR